jgi:hypothetical protein
MVKINLQTGVAGGSLHPPREQSLVWCTPRADRMDSSLVDRMMGKPIPFPSSRAFLIRG